MTFKKAILSILFTTLSLCSFLAQGKCILMGKSEIKNENFAYLYRVNDYLVFNQELIGSSSISADGTFQFEVTLTGTEKYEIVIDNIHSPIYLSEGNEYTVVFPAWDKSKPKSISGKNQIALKLYNLDSLDINNIIGVAHSLYDKFFYYNYPLIAQKHGAGRKLDSNATSKNPLRDALNEYYKQQKNIFSPVTDTFALQYIEYMNANLEQKLYPKRTKKHFHQFIENKPVLLANPEYVSFVRTYYQNLIKGIAYTGRHKELYNHIKQNSPYDSIQKIIGRNEYLKIPELQQLVFLDLLHINYVTKQISEDNIEFYLNNFMNDDSFSNNIKRYATSVLRKIKHIKVGEKAYDFELVSAMGDTVSLSDLEGKYVYLNFWDDWCFECLAEMTLYKDFNRKYRKSIQFVTIYLGQDSLAYQKFKKLIPNANWYFLNAGEELETLKNNYEIRSMPLYYLIDSYGNFKMAPALSPIPNGTGKAIDEVFYYIQNKKFPKKKKYVGGSKELEKSKK